MGGEGFVGGLTQIADVTDANRGFGSHPPPNPPTRASIFEQLLDYLGRSNLVWKLYSTKLDQLAI